MKKLAIYFADPLPMGNPFDSVYYWEIYQSLIKDIEAQGIGVYIVRGVSSYLGKGVFSHGWQVKNGELLSFDQPILVDLIFHRGNFTSIPASYDWPMINHPDFERLCCDKGKIAELFGDISPKTKAINSFQEYLEIIARWNISPEEKIVLKKNFLSGGKGIYVLPVKDISESQYDEWRNVLVQEFIDSSIGISGIVDGLHDLRVISINGEPVYSYIRIPKSGSFLANIAQGGTPMVVPLDKLPAELFTMVDRINKNFSKYKPSIIGADFFNSKDGFKLIELNAPPGVRNPKFSPQDRELQGRVVQMLVDALK